MRAFAHAHFHAARDELRETFRVRPPSSRFALVAAAAIALATVAVYAPVRHYPYAGLDDNEYVYENPAVVSGLNASSVEWALTAYHSGHWHPLTWLSLMTDRELFGPDPGPSHVANVVLHVLASLVLMFALKEATGRPVASALAAALFALHPLRVESVAWIAARKDMLSGFFLMALLWSYVRYARRPTALRYAGVAACFGLALLSKPTVAVVPFGLLLLDYWPLGRTPWSPAHAEADGAPKTSPARLLVEKLPLLAMAIATLAQTWAAQNAAGAVRDAGGKAFGIHVANALWNYVLYVGATVWPTRLAIFYPLRPVGLAQAAAGVVLLASVTAVCVAFRRTRPWLLVGWLWFAGTLVPVIGFVQFGSQSMADRYAYIPHVGLALALAWEAASRTASWATPVRGAAAALLLGALALVSSRQVSYWRDNVTLFEHALEATGDNFLIENNLGTTLENLGRRDEAARHYFAAERLNPTWPEALSNSGIAYAWQGDLDRAVANFEKALAIRPDFAKAENNLGTALSHRGDPAGALVHFRRAVELDPGYVDALVALGQVCEAQGRLVEAEKTYTRLVELQPDSAPARESLARVRAAHAAWDARQHSAP